MALLPASVAYDQLDWHVLEEILLPAHVTRAAVHSPPRASAFEAGAPAELPMAPYLMMFVVAALESAAWMALVIMV
jgi:hypothetical protein